MSYIPFDDVRPTLFLYLQHHPEALRDSLQFKLGDCIPCNGGPRKLEDGFRDFGVSGGSAVDSALVVVDRREDGVLTEFVETPGLQRKGERGNGARNPRFEGLEVNFEVGLQDENGGMTTAINLLELLAPDIFVSQVNSQKRGTLNR